MHAARPKSKHQLTKINVYCFQLMNEIAPHSLVIQKDKKKTLKKNILLPVVKWDLPLRRAFRCAMLAGRMYSLYRKLNWMLIHDVLLHNHNGIGCHLGHTFYLRAMKVNQG